MANEIYRYQFQRVQVTGYSWHALQKIKRITGMEDVGGHSTPDMTEMIFPQPLTPQQETDLANLLLQPDLYDPGFPGFQATPDNCLYIDDIFDKDADFAGWLASIGISGLDGLRWFLEKVPNAKATWGFFIC